jgi:hypothetical protein
VKQYNRLSYQTAIKYAAAYDKKNGTDIVSKINAEYENVAK